MSDAKILIVEDEGIEALDIQHRLISLGYPAPDIVFSGEDAVRKAAETSPDLVLMDIMLNGEIDGVTAAEQIHARSDIPIIYLTAYADEDTLRRARITEPYGYIVKPFKDREVHITIDMALYRHSMEKKLRDSEKRFSTILRSIGDAVIATDSKGLITFMNAAAEGLTGWKLEEALGKKLPDVSRIVSWKTRGPVENPISSPIKDDKGGIIGVIHVFRDVTERERDK